MLIVMGTTAKEVLFFIVISSVVLCSFGGRKIGTSTNIIAKTIYGDSYECVNIYEQPSLQHSAMKDPKVKERIYKYLEEVIAKMKFNTKNSSSFKNGLWIEEGCPIGTVPIRQMTEEHLEVARNSSKSLSYNPLDWEHDRIDFAGLLAKSVPKSDVQEYTGSSAIINIWNPHVEDGSEQYSSASMIIENGANQIQVGWIVYPKLYRDQKTRMYTSWTADNHQKTGCFNTLCPGFVQTNRKIPLDYVYPHISRREKEQYDSQFTVRHVPKLGWMFSTGSSPEIIGHWPDHIFTSMKKSAQQIRFGGQVYTPPSDRKSPPMGSGKWDYNQWDKTCYMRNVLIENARHIIIPPEDYFIKVIWSRCYTAAANGYLPDPHWYYRFMFGSEGGYDKATCVYK